MKPPDPLRLDPERPFAALVANVAAARAAIAAIAAHSNGRERAAALDEIGAALAGPLAEAYAESDVWRTLHAA